MPVQSQGRGVELLIVVKVNTVHKRKEKSKGKTNKQI